MTEVPAFVCQTDIWVYPSQLTNIDPEINGHLKKHLALTKKKPRAPCQAGFI